MYTIYEALTKKLRVTKSEDARYIVHTCLLVSDIVYLSEENM